MRLKKKIMAVTSKNDNVLERLEIINKYLEMLDFAIALDEEGRQSLYVDLINEGGLTILMNNIKRAIDTLSDNSFDLVEIVESLED